MSAPLFSDLSATLLCQGHTIRFRATGRSMLPTIRDGEEVTVEPVAPRDVKRGDILLYQGAKGLIAHRVVRFESNQQSAVSTQSSVLSPQHSLLGAQSSLVTTHHSFILRGDAAITRDEPVGYEQILGRVVAVERHDRNILLTGVRARLMHRMRECALGLACFSGIRKIYRLVRGVMLSIYTAAAKPR
ncbi:MAG: S24/S26 family peptidase [Deltaproteobacteria bacterium]|nr:S24/S26 family peptidase [Deltaproteobacteria bacterium]